MNVYFYYAETKGSASSSGRMYVNGIYETSKEVAQVLSAIEADLKERLGHKFVVINLSRLR